MSAFRGATGVLLVLASSCLSQNKGGVDQRVAVPMVQKILSNADLSGSLEYWGFCDENKGWPDFPEPRHVSGHEGPALDVLKEMFADDPKMRVTQAATSQTSPAVSTWAGRPETTRSYSARTVRRRPCGETLSRSSLRALLIFSICAGRRW